MPVTSSNVDDAVSTHIYKQAINAIGYNVPLNEAAKVWQLPVSGDILRIPRSDEAAEMSTAGKNTRYDLTQTAAESTSVIEYDEYTINEWIEYTEILKWAEFRTALDVAKIMGNRLIGAAARTMNTESYNALVDQDGLQMLRVDGETNSGATDLAAVEAAVILAGSPSLTASNSDAAQINDYWNNGQIVFTSGSARGLSRAVTDFVQSSGVITYDTLPTGLTVPSSGDTAFLFVLGNGISNGPTDLDSTDTITLAQLYRARERCLRFGAGALGMEGDQLDVTGITRKRDGHIRQGLIFMPTQIVHELQVTLAGNAAAQDSAYFQTSEGFRRAVGGVVLNIGGLMVIPVNHFRRMAISNGALSSSTGAGFPSVVLYPNAFGCTTLKDNRGSRQGLTIVAKKISPKSDAYMFGSVKWRGEADLINAYFCPNSLHGCTMWSGTGLS